MKLKKLALLSTTMILMTSNLSFANQNGNGMVSLSENEVRSEYQTEEIKEDEQQIKSKTSGIENMHRHLILESLKNDNLTKSEQDDKIKLINISLNKFIESRYSGLKSDEYSNLETEILQYILDRNMGHDPMPQYYASINMDMKTENYIRENYGIEINENIKDSIIYLINDFYKVVSDTGLLEFDVTEKIVSLLSLQPDEDLINIADEKLNLGLKDSLNSKDIATKGYTETSAMSYADKWDGTKRNPSYRDFGNEGGDCANFVSQILYSGGMTMKQGSNTDSTSYWFYNGSSLNQISGSWRGANMFRWHWSSRAGGLTDVSASQTKNNFKTAVYDKAYQGDAISLINSNGSAYHTIFVNKRNTTSQDFKYSAHSDSGNHSSLKSRISGYRVFIYYL